MVNKDFCLSLYIAFLYIWKDGVDFAKGFLHKNFRPVEDNDSIPVKITMLRPVDSIFNDWKGPRRPEFRNDILMESLTGNQKWQLWCTEQFLNLIR